MYKQTRLCVAASITVDIVVDQILQGKAWLVIISCHVTHTACSVRWPDLKITLARDCLATINIKADSDVGYCSFVSMQELTMFKEFTSE